MKKSRFSEDKIIKPLKRSYADKKVVDICREHSFRDVTFYTWRKKYGGLDKSELRRLKQLESENKTLKTLLAEAMLDKEALQEFLTKKF